MQKNIVKLSVALLLALLISSLSACSDGGGDEKLNGGAALSSISVAGYPVTTVPTPIPARDWNDEEVLLSGLGAEYTTQLVVKTAAELTSAAVVVEASAGAKLQYAVELSASKPGADAFSNNATVALSPNNYLYIRVTSEDGRTINYYRIRVTTESADKNLTSVTIGTVSVTTLGTPADTYAQAVAGTVALTNEQNSDVAVTAVPSNASATVKYAKVSGDSAPTFADSLTTDFADGDFVYIEVTAQNGEDKNIYKIEVQIGRNANLSGLTIGDASVTNLGVPAASVADTIAGGFLFGTSNADNVTVAATPADGAATVKYAKATGDAAPTFDDTSTFSFNDQDFLYIEVTAANTTTKLVYKIQVNLQQKATIK